jgi:hypothetical protein
MTLSELSIEDLETAARYIEVDLTVPSREHEAVPAMVRLLQVIHTELERRGRAVFGLGRGAPRRERQAGGWG